MGAAKRGSRNLKLKFKLIPMLRQWFDYKCFNSHLLLFISILSTLDTLVIASVTQERDSDSEQDSDNVIRAHRSSQAMDIRVMTR